MDFLLNPNLAYLLLLTGALLGLLALVTPGTGGLELGALFCLTLVGYPLTQLDFNLWALLIFVLSVIPFLYSIRRQNREAFLALSILMLVIGSAYLFQNETGWWLPAVNPLLAFVASILFAGFIWFAIRKSMQAFLAPPTHNLGALVGQVGEAKTDVHADGSVQVAGELWSARSKNPIPAGKQVRVVGREGFILDVESESNPPGN
ncbi:MAG: NfeD family protein [Chloroflexota bacterium]